MAKNAFDELLASFTEESDRQAITGLAEKYPTLKQSVLRQADYSRHMDELKAERQKLQAEADYAAAMKKWREENWIDNYYSDGVGALKREVEKDQRIAELSGAISELEAKVQVGDEVTFDQLSEHFGKLAEQRKFVSQDVLQTELNKTVSGAKQTIDQQLAGFAHIALKAPKLATRHYKTFNDELDTDGLVDFASKNGFNDLEKAYDAFTADKRNELDAKKRAEEIEAVKKQTREEAEKEFAAKQTPRMPDDTGGPEMSSGHFFKRIAQLGAAGDPGSEADPPLGSIARTLGRTFDANAE
jgi:hypothetical protein